MASERTALDREIAALEAKLDARKTAREASVQKPREKSAKDTILAELSRLAKMVEAGYMDEEVLPEVSACGEAFMDDDVEVDDDDFESMMDDDLIDEPVVLDSDDDLMLASETEAGAEDEITQDYLDDVVELRGEEGLATEDSMLDAAPTGYVARLKSASTRLDRVASYLQKQGNDKLAFRIDQISDAIDARIAKEEANNG